MELSKSLSKIGLPEQVFKILDKSPSLLFPNSREELIKLSTNEEEIYNVSYDVDGKGIVNEANVMTCKNGLSINYFDPYMRRRDPDCLFIGDNKPTDKPKFSERFNKKFDPIRTETFAWLEKQKLIVMPFILGSFDKQSGYGAILIAPENAAFFVTALADLQGMLPCNDIPDNFKVRSIVYLAPPFRHTHFDGKQVVVHNRLEEIHEVFSYNLYLGPSAKKGIFGVLLSIGEDEDWLTLHGSTVQVVTPYDNITTIMHEGASGSGKSEMLEYIHREDDGRIKIGVNTVTKEKRFISLTQGCTLNRVSDDMAMCHPQVQNKSGYLVVSDAEDAWFMRVDHIDHYGAEPHLERLTVHPPEPLIFLNIQGTPKATCLIWEHTEDSPGKRCSNPRVILPRRFIPNVVNGTVEVMIRNFGLRTPPCTKQNPSYGIAGILHILPPALAWLWRLVSPRGYANPSIIDSSDMTSEGVGSYWPFATGLMVAHANMLLRQILQTPNVRYTLTPNQHVGAWYTSFKPQWIAREYLARRGIAKFPQGKLSPARCALFGHTLNSMQIEGTLLPEWMLKVEMQPEVETEGYDKGAEQLRDFFRKELAQFKSPYLDTTGKRIIECFNDNGTAMDYENIMPGVDFR